MLTVGLVGFGLAGKVFHAPVIRAVEGLRLTAIVQRSGGGAPDPRYSDVEFLRSVDELLTRAIDLVVIATPNTSHHPIAKQCLLAGRHVVVDKPFTTTVAEAEELVQLGAEKRRVLSAYQNRRYVGDFVTLRKLLSEGVLGRVTIFESHFDRFRPELRPGAWREQPQPGSGIWFDLGSHALDQALVLFGIPDAISADIRSEREGAATDDAFDVTLHYPRLRALLRASMLAASPGPAFAVHGTHGSFYGHASVGCLHVRPVLNLRQEKDVKAMRAIAEEAFAMVRDYKGSHSGEHGDGSRTIPTIPSSFTHYYENIRDAILGKAQVAVTPEQALNVMRGLELAVTSSRKGCVLPWTLPRIAP